MSNDKRTQISLLALRLSVFLVMLIWTIDKFVNPAHGIAVYENFYFIGGLAETVMVGIGAVEILILLLFVAGLFRTWTYGAVLVFHSVSTFSSWAQYLSPFEGNHLLFFAAWPMWAACLALFLLRDQDRMFSASA